MFDYLKRQINWLIKKVTCLENCCEKEYTLSPISETNEVSLLKDNVVISTIDLSPYLDNTNLSRIVSGSVDGSGIATFTRDDASFFTVDLSSLAGNGGDYNFTELVEYSPGLQELQERHIKKQLLSYSNSVGALCIKVNRGIRSFTLRTLEYNFPVSTDWTEYIVSGYTLNGDTWASPTVQKRGTNQRTVRLYAGGGEYRIYIGEITDVHPIQVRTLFPDQILTISSTSIVPGDPLNDPILSMTVETSFQGTLQATF